MRARHHRAFEMNWWVFTTQKDLATCVESIAVLNDCNVSVGHVRFRMYLLSYPSVMLSLARIMQCRMVHLLANINLEGIREGVVVT
jgi:hypothetical protein